MKWFIYIALIVGCIYLADKANDYMQPLSLIEVVQEKKTPYEGWQFWNNQSHKADRYIYYTLHGNGWEVKLPPAKPEAYWVTPSKGFNCAQSALYSKL